MLVSPLRYPGGKSKLFEYFTHIIRANNLFDCMYCEPYAGGAGLALRLLSSGFVGSISLNDIDESIYAFWNAVIQNPTEFCALIESVPITIDEWHRQKAIWSSKDMSDSLTLGFSAFYLNRTNRSGIIEGAGPIGGYSQVSKWKLDARFNRRQQIQNISAIANYRDQIKISNVDALDFISSRFEEPRTFCYLDPPYYIKGSKLYRNSYGHTDHVEIMKRLAENREATWVVSYDDVPQIREIYAGFQPISYALNYSAGSNGTGREVIYFSDSLLAPDMPGFRIAA